MEMPFAGRAIAIIMQVKRNWASLLVCPFDRLLDGHTLALIVVDDVVEISPSGHPTNTPPLRRGDGTA